MVKLTVHSFSQDLTTIINGAVFEENHNEDGGG
jgi:hypothetical protein